MNRLFLKEESHRVEEPSHNHDERIRFVLSLSFKLPPYSIVAIQALPSGFCLRTFVTNIIMNLRWKGKGV